MNVNKVIIHELSKSGISGTKLGLTNKLLDHTHIDVIRLINQLNTRYRKRNEKQGIFDAENPTEFHKSFRTFKNSLSENDFIDFTHISSKDLKNRIEGIGSAKGGYLVFAEYFDYRPYCSVFFVRDTTGIVFKRNKTYNSFDLSKVEHIDFERLAMACRINMESFEQENSKYLSFIHNKSDEISQYFIKWIATSDATSSETETKALLSVLRKIELPINPDTGDKFDRDFIIQSIHKHIHSNPTRTVNIVEISKNVFQDEDFLPNYIEEHYPDIPNEFKGHSKALRSFVKVYGKADNIELNFYPSAYREGKIKFDIENKNLIIIDSNELAVQIRQSLDQE